MNSYIPVILDALQNASGGTLGVWLSTMAVKAVPFIPVSPGQTSRIRAVAAALSVAAAVLVGIADGDLPQTSAEAAIMGIVTFVGSWAGAHGLHKLNKSLNRLFGGKGKFQS